MSGKNLAPALAILLMITMLVNALLWWVLSWGDLR